MWKISCICRIAACSNSSLHSGVHSDFLDYTIEENFEQSDFASMHSDVDAIVIMCCDDHCMVAAYEMVSYCGSAFWG